MLSPRTVDIASTTTKATTDGRIEGYPLHRVLLACSTDRIDAEKLLAINPDLDLPGFGRHQDLAGKLQALLDARRGV